MLNRWNVKRHYDTSPECYDNTDLLFCLVFLKLIFAYKGGTLGKHKRTIAKKTRKKVSCTNLFLSEHKPPDHFYASIKYHSSDMYIFAIPTL